MQRRCSKTGARLRIFHSDFVIRHYFVIRHSSFSLVTLRLSFIICLLVVLFNAPSHAQRLSALAPRPDWSLLEVFQETITREQFSRLLDQLYPPAAAPNDLIEIQPDT